MKSTLEDYRRLGRDKTENLVFSLEKRSGCWPWRSIKSKLVALFPTLTMRRKPTRLPQVK
jgi:hypothetical protein